MHDEIRLLECDIHKGTNVYKKNATANELPKQI